MPPETAPSWQPTDEQLAIVAAFSQPEPLLVSAYAGTAKTSSIALAAPQVKAPALALAFNRRIAEELKGKLPGNWRVMTLNGLGQLAWLRSLPPSTKLELDDRKIGKLIRQAAKAAKTDLSQDQWGQVRQLVGQAMRAGLSPDNEGQPLVPDSPETWTDLSYQADIYDEASRPMLIELARNCLMDSIALARQGIISFDDQTYCPTVLGGSWLKWPVLAVDEAQDLSRLNHQMLALSTRPGGASKVIAVGDSRQAIYAFRGADSDSMTNLQKLIAPGPTEGRTWQELRLTTTFRCPRRIVARQQRHAPGFRSADSTPDGLVKTIFARTPDEGGELGGWSWGQIRGLADGRIAVLCRNNAPLLSLAFSLIRQGIAPVMIGRDIGKGLQTLARQITGKRGPLAADLFRGALAEWELSQHSAALAEGREDRLDSIADRAEALRAVLDGTQARTSDELITALEGLFARAEGDLTLSTIHRAKGLEYDIVVHLDPWRVPSRQAKALAQAGDESALEQEWNLLYVAETRTRNVLVNASLEDFR